MLSAVIVAGGNSRRMGFDKVFVPIAGKPAIAYSLSAFQHAESVSEIIIVARDEVRADLQALINRERFDRVRMIVAAGEHRHDSVRAGLAAVAPEARYVAVHDAARPLITPAEIARVYDAAARHGAAVLAEPISDTVKRATAENFILESVERASLFAMQTPQIFERALLQRAYDEVSRRELLVTDEASALQLIGHPIALVAAMTPNFKATFSRDLSLIELILASRH